MSELTLPQIDQTLCDHCGLCVAHCPTDAIEMTPRAPRIVHPKDCTYCAECEAICPQHAIRCTYEIVWTRSEEQGERHV